MQFSEAWGRAVTAPSAATTSWLLSTADDRAEEPRPSEDPALLARVAQCPGDVALVLWDEEGRMAAASPGFEELTGFRAAEATGACGRFLRPGDEDPETRLQVALCKLHGVACRIRRSIVRKSGELAECVAHYQRLPAKRGVDGLTFSIFAFQDQPDAEASIDAAVAWMFGEAPRKALFLNFHVDGLSSSNWTRAVTLPATRVAFGEPKGLRGPATPPRASEAPTLAGDSDAASPSGSDELGDAMSKACCVDALGCRTDLRRALQAYGGTSALLASMALAMRAVKC